MDNYLAIAKETLHTEAKTLVEAADNLEGSFSDAVEMILACACGLRRIFPCNNPGSCMSAP